MVFWFKPYGQAFLCFVGVGGAQSWAPANEAGIARLGNPLSPPEPIPVCLGTQDSQERQSAFPAF